MKISSEKLDFNEVDPAIVAQNEEIAKASHASGMKSSGNTKYDNFGKIPEVPLDSDRPLFGY